MTSRSTVYHAACRVSNWSVVVDARYQLIDDVTSIEFTVQRTRYKTRYYHIEKSDSHKERTEMTVADS